MKTFWIFAALFGIFAVVAALPAYSGEQKGDEAPVMEVQAPEEEPPVVEAPEESPERQSGSGSDSWGSKVGTNKPKEQINVIEAPYVCPDGQLLDHNGVCRDMW
uniref:Secreted protein n=1 Tax=Lutzomyia longipalpis TaxID=7200 RepID=A0A1B0GIS9_LUTLO